MTAPKGYRPALDVLAELRRGRCQADLSEALHEVLAACMATGKPGEVVLKLRINPQKVGDFETPRIDVTDQIGTKKPQKSVHPSTFFLTDDGNPVRRDPNQDEFEPLREAPPVAGDTATTTSIDRKAN